MGPAGGARSATYEGVERVLAHSPFQAVWRLAGRGRLAVLAYHAVVDPSSFSRQLDYATRHLRPVSLDEVVGAIQGRWRLPTHAVLFTFDDGDRTVLDVAAPALQERGIPGVVFVVAGVLDTDTPFWWNEAMCLAAQGGTVEGRSVADGPALLRALKRFSDDDRLAALRELRRTAKATLAGHTQLRGSELAQLEGMGIDVASHTMTHPCLPACSAEKVETEIRASHALLTSALGHEPHAFAYPNGDWDPRAERILKELDYTAAFLFDHRLADTRTLHPLRISRIRVDAAASTSRFRILVSGLHPSILQLRGLE